MDHYKVVFNISQDAGEILVAFLADSGFDMFEESADGVTAYIPAEGLDEPSVRGLILEVSEEFRGNDWSVELIKARNWNETWERSFSPVTVSEKVVVRAPFHEAPAAGVIDLIVEPKMSFGTGHHPTTALMIAAMLETGWEGTSVLDMGCGSGILAILAEKLGATKVLAIDIDDWAVDNTAENISRNSCSFISVEKGNALNIGESKFDRILANINRNILLHDLSHYVAAMKDGAVLFMSGFLDQDKEVITESAVSAGLTPFSGLSEGQWQMLSFIKRQNP